MLSLTEIRARNAMTFYQKKHSLSGPSVVYTVEGDYVCTAASPEVGEAIVQSLNDHAKQQAARNEPLWPKGSDG